jgi:hypothetical protein
MTVKSALICATAIAIALTSVDLRPAAAADGAGIAQQSTDVSAARKRRGHAPRYYQRPVYQQRDYYSRWGGSGGQPGYRGPNVNVPGPTNYGNAAGQNGQAPPPVSNPPPGGSN